MTRTLTAIVTKAFIAGAIVVSMASTSSAGTIRDHRGQAQTLTQPTTCGSFKYCAKTGWVVRDHRTGATNPGK